MQQRKERYFSEGADFGREKEKLRRGKDSEIREGYVGKINNENDISEEQIDLGRGKRDIRAR